MLLSKLLQRNSLVIIRTVSTSPRIPIHNTLPPFKPKSSKPKFPLPPLLDLSVAILGPPNAGKSTLFNRLHDRSCSSSKRLQSSSRSKNRRGSQSGGNAIVTNVPGTTRDRRETTGRIAGVRFKVS